MTFMETMAGCCWNVAVTELFEARGRLHVGALPEQAPDQPENTALLPGCADSVTMVPSGCVVLQLLAQVLVCPLNVALSVPLPPPVFE
jgi:hypothetical protein